MKALKIDAVRELPNDEINTRIEEQRKNIFDLRLRAGSDDIENPGSVKAMRREIARMYTVLRERAREKERS